MIERTSDGERTSLISRLFSIGQTLTLQLQKDLYKSPLHNPVVEKHSINPWFHIKVKAFVLLEDQNDLARMNEVL